MYLEILKSMKELWWFSNDFKLKIIRKICLKGIICILKYNTKFEDILWKSVVEKLKESKAMNAGKFRFQSTGSLVEVTNISRQTEYNWKVWQPSEKFHFHRYSYLVPLKKWGGTCEMIKEYSNFLFSNACKFILEYILFNVHCSAIFCAVQLAPKNLLLRIMMIVSTCSYRKVTLNWRW